MITVQDVELRAGARLLLSGVTFRVQPGDRIGLVGRNGAGKTTVTDLVARFHDPTRGRILLNGRPIFLRGNAINPPDRNIPDSLEENRRFVEPYVRYLKSVGVNIIRLTRHSQVWFDVCDELGMMLFQGNYGTPKGGTARSAPSVPVAAPQQSPTTAAIPKASALRSSGGTGAVRTVSGARSAQSSTAPNGCCARVWNAPFWSACCPPPPNAICSASQAMSRWVTP